MTQHHDPDHHDMDYPDPADTNQPKRQEPSQPTQPSEPEHLGTLYPDPPYDFNSDNDQGLKIVMSGQFRTLAMFYI